MTPSALKGDNSHEDARDGVLRTPTQHQANPGAIGSKAGKQKIRNEFNVQPRDREMLK